MKRIAAYQFLVFLLVVQVFFSSCDTSKPSSENWLQITLPMSEWQRSNRNVFNKLDSISFASGSAWECFIDDSLLLYFEKVCWMAPDSLQFDLSLNGVSLVHNDGRYLWPSSFSEKDIYIYPNNWELRPFVIDSLKLKSSLKATDNLLQLKIINSSKAGELTTANCGLFISKREEKVIKGIDIYSNHKYQQGDLPSVYLDSKDFVIPIDRKVNGRFRVACSQSNQCKELDREIMIEVRGFSSTNFPKKQYSFFFTGDSTKKEKTPLLDMKAAKRWILQGPYTDPSLVRNALAYETWRKMGYWSPQSRYVELVLNGTYQGVYLLMERVEANKARLNITSGDTIKEPFLIQLNRPGKDDTTARAGGNTFILYKTPRKGKDDLQYKATVSEALNEWMKDMEHPLDANDVDWNSFADFILLQELLKNVDAYYVSTFFHCDGKKILAGPVWDFDLSLGTCSNLDGKSSEGWVYEINKKGIPAFWKLLVGDEKFQKLMKERYQHFRQNSWSTESLSNSLDSLVNLIGKDAIDRNFYRYPVWGMKQLQTYSDVPLGHKQEIEGIRLFIENRLIWMDKFYLRNDVQ